MSDLNFNSQTVRPVTPIEGKALSAFSADTSNSTSNAATTTKLQYSRKINGVDFDGSQDITLPGAVLIFDSEIKSFMAA